MISLNPLDYRDVIVVAATVLIFSATFVALRKVFVLPYLEVMEARSRLFETADEQLQEKADVLSSAEDDAQRQVTEAREQADAIMKQASETAETYRRERLSSTTQTASERLEKGRAEIARTRDSEIERLRGEASECVGLACVRLLGEIDPTAVENAVDQLMARRAN
jgi:F0F1-type ATP synthase membrane subunit b/b'